MYFNFYVYILPRNNLNDLNEQLFWKLQTWVRLSLNNAMSGKNGACNVLTKLFVMSCSSEWLMLQPYYLFGPSHLFWFAWNSWWNLEFTFPWPFLHLFRPFHLLYCWNSCWKLEFNCNFSRFFFFILFEMPQSISIWHNNWNSKEYWISDYVKAKSYLINSFKNNLCDGRNLFILSYLFRIEQA